MSYYIPIYIYRDFNENGTLRENKKFKIKHFIFTEKNILVELKNNVSLEQNGLLSWENYKNAPEIFLSKSQLSICLDQWLKLVFSSHTIDFYWIYSISNNICYMYINQGYRSCYGLVRHRSAQTAYSRLVFKFIFYFNSVFSLNSVIWTT